MTDPALRDAKTGMAAVYERQAGWWHEVRLRTLYEKPWLDRLVAGLPTDARILDLGCGTGDPLAHYLLGLGYHVVGVDAASSMIEIAQATTPPKLAERADWHVADMRTLPDLGSFDAILSWDAAFHLSVDEQRALLPDLCERIRTGGALLMTVGHAEGEVGGAVNDEPVYHASLAPKEYREILSMAGFNDIHFIAEDKATLGRSVLLGTHKA